MHRYREFIESHVCLAYSCIDEAEGKSRVRVELYFPEAGSVCPAKKVQRIKRHNKRIFGRGCIVNAGSALD